MSGAATTMGGRTSGVLPAQGDTPDPGAQIFGAVSAISGGSGDPGRFGPVGSDPTAPRAARRPGRDYGHSPPLIAAPGHKRPYEWHPADNGYATPASGLGRDTPRGQHMTNHAQRGPDDALNPLQALIADHMANTGDSLADIATRGGLPRQTVSGLLNRDTTGGIPRRSTLQKLATGLGLSLATVIEAAAATASAGNGTSRPAPDHRLAVLIDMAERMPPRDVDVLLATARALTRQAPDTPGTS
jgi:transcriptional regulator with XRE-family HTH domain